MQSIIIPIDFTKRSNLALDYAFALFSPEKVRFILLHAYSTLPTSELLISIDDIIERDIYQKLEEQAKYFRLKTKSEKVNIVKVCERNNLISAITNASLKYHADLLILGTDGKDSWSDVAFPDEGKTLNIVSEIALPALIIPMSEKHHKPESILFATLLDGIKEANEIQPLIELAKNCHAHIDILNVGLERTNTTSLDKGLSKTINGYFKEVAYELHTVLNSDTQSAIDEFSESHHSDLICIIYRRHGVLEELLNQGISKKIISQAEWPILALKQIG